MKKFTYKILTQIVRDKLMYINKSCKNTGKKNKKIEKQFYFYFNFKKRRSFTYIQNMNYLNNHLNKY